MVNQKYLDKAEVLIEALPYIKRFNRKIVVVKYGGSAMLDDELKKNVIKDVVLLKLVGFKPIIVHGGGKEISRQNTGDDDRSMLRHLCQNQHINRAAKQCDRQRAKECQYGKESKDSLTNHGAYHIQGSKDSSGNQIAYR